MSFLSKFCESFSKVFVSWSSKFFKIFLLKLSEAMITESSLFKSAKVEVLLLIDDSRVFFNLRTLTPRAIVPKNLPFSLVTPKPIGIIGYFIDTIAKFCSDFVSSFPDFSFKDTF